MITVKGSPVRGPLYAPHGYGKGVVGRLYNLDGLLDDQKESLEDFGIENGDAMLLQAVWYRAAHGKYRSPRARLCHRWDDVWTSIQQRVAANDDADEQVPAMPPAKRRR